jgi:hypothetical protein
MRSLKCKSSNGLVEINKWYKILFNENIWLVQVYSYDVTTMKLCHKGDCYILDDEDDITNTYPSKNGVYHGWGLLLGNKITKVGRSELKSIFLKNDIRRTYK